MPLTKGMQTFRHWLDLFFSPDFPSATQFITSKIASRKSSIEIEKIVLALAADRVFDEGLARCKLVIVGYGTGRGNGGAHQDQRSVAVKDMHRSMKHALMRCSAAMGKGYIMDSWGHLTAIECRCCEGRSSTLRTNQMNMQAKRRSQRCASTESTLAGISEIRT